MQVKILIVIIIVILLNYFGITSSNAGSNKGPIDLTYYFDNDTNYWIGATPFQFIKEIAVTRPTGVFYSINEFKCSEHGGTHMDAPYHFNKHGWKIGDIPVRNLFGRGVLINAKYEAQNNPNYTLPASKLINWEQENGPIPAQSIILVNFGWSRYYNNKTAYYGTVNSSSTQLSFPGLSEEAADWLIRTKRVVGIGVDTLSVDPGNTDDFAIHTKLASANIWLLENVALDNHPLPPLGFSVLALPMKIRKGTGAPCRVIALPHIDLYTHFQLT